MNHYKLYIGGKWTDTKEKFDVMEKYTGEPFATIAQASKKHVDDAVRSARSSFNKTKLTPVQRYEILMNLSGIIKNNKDMIAEILCKEVGKPYNEALAEICGVIENYINYAEEAKRITGEMVPVDGNSGSENRIGFTMRVPAGIVCAITPFNFPFSLTTSKIGPAIAAGNTVIVKPTQQTPVSVCQLVKFVLEAGLPEEHIQLVMGPGAVTGEWLLQNKDINFYSFTGSSQVGEHITNTIGIRRSTMELGSNAAVIVHRDADVIKAAKDCAIKGFANSGQVCQSVQRIIVHEDVAGMFVKKAKEVAESIVLGNPFDKKTTMGPLISISEVKRVDGWVKEAVEKGAKIIAGGEIYKERFYLPTILTEVTRDMKVFYKEVFGPVIVIIIYRNFDEAIDLVNDSEYGLQAGIYTKDINLAMKAAKEIVCGGIMINDTTYYKARNMPYGGLKKSGFGKEGAKYAVNEMTDEKVIILNL